MTLNLGVLKPGGSSRAKTSSTDAKGWLAHVRTCKYLPEPDVLSLIELAKDLVIEEGNIHPLNLPVSVCGDIHGQFYDLLELFSVGGEIPYTKYVFMGDYVDRGYYSLETITFLLCLKVLHPEGIFLLRGNHETRQISQVYGFYDECIEKYGSAVVWRSFMGLFDYFTIGVIIDSSILCVHGGLSPDLRTIDQIRTIDRVMEVPGSGPLTDLLWSDPDADMTSDWQINSRGCGYLFGRNPTKQFCELNSLTMVARAHQLVLAGYEYLFDKQLLTVWSAPNYGYKCANSASILVLHGDGSQELKIFEAVPLERNPRPIKEKKQSKYFL
jgi:serine/threonine-protein phosphatase 6 catalytic subunit